MNSSICFVSNNFMLQVTFEGSMHSIPRHVYLKYLLFSRARVVSVTSSPTACFSVVHLCDITTTALLK